MKDIEIFTGKGKAAETFQQLIPIARTEVENKKIPTVNARELHEFLKVETRFDDWIRRRVEEYGFVEELDYVKVDSSKLRNQNGRGGNRRSIDYHLTIGAAKELSMVEKTEKGREARRYFIRCEEAALRNFMDDHTRAKIVLYLAEEMRPWQKTFPDELWIEFARLTGRELEGSQRPQYWGKLVNEFIYGYLDEDVKNWLRDNAPKSTHGKRYHQHFNEQFGLKKLTEHMWLVIGTARSSFSIVDLRNRLELQFARKPSQLSFFIPIPAQQRQDRAGVQ